MKNLKKRLKQGETLNGCWLNLGSALTAEIVGQAGFDWVLIDLEHGAGEEKDVMSQLQALEHSTTAVLVRVESASGQRIHRVLDMGAEGIMCPHINNKSEAVMGDGGKGTSLSASRHQGCCKNGARHRLWSAFRRIL
jgi:4-hydroxy-2-oxoheptanedioate aldolase